MGGEPRGGGGELVRLVRVAARSAIGAFEHLPQFLQGGLLRLDRFGVERGDGVVGLRDGRAAGIERFRIDRGADRRAQFGEGGVRLAPDAGEVKRGLRRERDE